MNEEEKLSNEINYFASYKKAFSVETILDFSTNQLTASSIYTYLITDDRFLALNGKHNNSDLFISKKVVSDWFIVINVRLAKIKMSKLSKNQFGYFLSSLLDADNHKETAQTITEFGKRLSLIDYSDIFKQYTFPIAHILSFVRASAKTLVKLLKPTVEHPSMPSDGYIADTIKKTLLELEQRELYILQAREGFNGEKKQTLFEIAKHLGLTRERVRQLQKKAYQHKAFFTPFLKIILQEIVCRNGNLLFKISKSEKDTRCFLAKCLNIPTVKIKRFNLLLLGTDQNLFPSLNPKVTSLAENNIIKCLNKNNKFCLIDSGNRVFEKSYINYWRRNSMLTEKLYLVLNSIGKPSHYSIICEKYNDIFPKQPKTERHIHAALGREEQGVVWIGLKGTYALTEWGHKRPRRTLLETARDIVEKKYKETRRPVPYEVIVTEFGKHRKIVNQNSLITSICCNPYLTRVGYKLFIPNISADEHDLQDDIDLDKILEKFEENIKRE